MTLFFYFFRQKSGLNLRVEELPQEIGDIVQLYSCPGNIRELQNVCERFSLYLENNHERNVKFLRRCMVRAIGKERLLKDILNRYGSGKENEAQLVALLQEIFGYSKKQAGEKPGMSRTTVWRLQKQG